MKPTTATELDHPCKETCSGWKQGYDKGYAHAQANDPEVLALVSALNYAKGQIIGTIEAHYFQMGKEYLAKERVEKATAHIDKCLAAFDKRGDK